MQKRNDIVTGILFSLLNSFSLGILGIIDKIGTKQFSSSIVFSLQSVCFSLVFVSIFVLLYFRGSFSRQVKKLSLTTWWQIVLVGIFASGLYILFRFLGLTQATGTFATIAQVVITAETAILSLIFLREKLSNIFWLLFILVLIAIYFVSVGNFTFTALQKGDMYIIIGATFVAFANIFSKFVVNKASPLLLSQGRFFFGALFLLLTAIFFHTANIVVFSIWSVLSGFFWAVNVIAFNSAIKKIGVTFATALLMTAPIYTMVLEYFFLKQNFNLIQIIAALVVILSGIVMVLTKNRSFSRT